MKLKTMMMTLSMEAAMTAAAQGDLQSGIDKKNMNLAAKPGTDFFEYATGGWMKAHPLTPEYARYSQFDALAETNRKQLQQLIEGLAADKDAAHGTLQQKIGGLYRLAMDSVRRNAEGYDPLKPHLKMVEDIADKRAFQYVAGCLGRIGVGSFFGLSCDADLRNAKQNLVQIHQGGICMGERSYYLEDDEATQKVRAAYRAYGRKLFTLTGKSEAEAAKMMEAVERIETRIAKASYSRTKLRDVEGNYHKMTYARLLSDFPGIDWSTLFLTQGVPAVEEVSVNQPEPIHEVEKVLEECPLEDLKAYLYFNVVDNATGKLSDDFRAAAFEFYSKTMSGAEQDRPRWKRAVQAVEGVLGMAIGKMYVEKYFPETSKQRMQKLVGDLQIALGQKIEAQQWMSAETKARAQEKLNAFYVKIGYPDEWMSYDALDIDESLSYYENMARAAKFRGDYYIERHVNKPVDRTEWLMTPQTINAYYNPTTNEICFPAGILQPPFFDAAADDAYNYGAIGVVIGHEMTHGFDDQGSQFDKDGNLSNWWTEADKKAFAERTAVMERFFNGIEVLPGLKANGKLTLGENIADHGGLNVAYLAFQNAQKSAAKPAVAKDGFTPEQRFFLSYSFLWANNVREEMLRKLTKTDPHSAGRWRVNGALPHIDAWYEAFNIKKKDPLFVPKAKRVDVW